MSKMLFSTIFCLPSFWSPETAIMDFSVRLNVTIELQNMTHPLLITLNLRITCIQPVDALELIGFIDIQRLNVTVIRYHNCTTCFLKSYAKLTK